MRPSRAQYADVLRALAPGEVPAYLVANSDLPGPRSNLTLLDAAADVLPRGLALRLAEEPDEFLACCGVATLGRLILEDPTDAGLVVLLTAKSTDVRWRVREAVAMAAQRIGDHDPAGARALAGRWAADPDPLTARAGIAALCEPRLLADPLTAEAALTACADATATLLAVPRSRRREPNVRVLRQGLGYCWSVAVAGDPLRGLPRFLDLPVDDPDVAWIVRENRGKRRLARLLADV